MILDPKGLMKGKLYHKQKQKKGKSLPSKRQKEYKMRKILRDLYKETQFVVEKGGGGVGMSTTTPQKREPTDLPLIPKGTNKSSQEKEIYFRSQARRIRDLIMKI